MKCDRAIRPTRGVQPAARVVDGLHGDLERPGRTDVPGIDQACCRLIHMQTGAAADSACVRDALAHPKSERRAAAGADGATGIVLQRHRGKRKFAVSRDRAAVDDARRAVDPHGTGAPIDDPAAAVDRRRTDIKRPCGCFDCPGAVVQSAVHVQDRSRSRVQDAAIGRAAADLHAQRAIRGDHAAGIVQASRVQLDSRARVGRRIQLAAQVGKGCGRDVDCAGAADAAGVEDLGIRLVDVQAAAAADCSSIHQLLADSQFHRAGGSHRAAT